MVFLSTIGTKTEYAFTLFGGSISILKVFLVPPNPLDKPWQQNSVWWVFPQWPLDDSELIFLIFLHVYTAFGWITMYFISVMLLVDHAVLIPGCATNFSVFLKFYQWIFFPVSFIKSSDKYSDGFYCYVLVPETSLLNNPPLTEAFGELSAWDGSYAL